MLFLIYLFTPPFLGKDKIQGYKSTFKVYLVEAPFKARFISAMNHHHSSKRRLKECLGVLCGSRTIVLRWSFFRAFFSLYSFLFEISFQHLHLKIFLTGSPQWDLNSRPLVYKTSALTTELWRHILVLAVLASYNECCSLHSISAHYFAATRFLWQLTSFEQAIFLTLLSNFLLCRDSSQLEILATYYQPSKYALKCELIMRL